MLNISLKRVDEKIDTGLFKSFKMLQQRSITHWLLRLIYVVSVILIAAMFLPWTQNIRSFGYVTTLRPSDRPQNIQALIGGKIEKWYVIEGDTVSRGDTIIQISEIKEEYLDPEILMRTQNQIEAKQESVSAYEEKASNIKNQLQALMASREIKLQQNEIKRRQIKLKLSSDSIDLVAAELKNEIAERQLNRMQELYNEGLKSLTDLETKKLAVQEIRAKVVFIRNKINEGIAELQNIDANIIEIENDFQDKIAKSRSELNSAMSNQFNTTADVNKLQSQYNAYEVRRNNYFITSPIDGIITKAIKSGIGEMLKNTDNVVSIMPLHYNLAVEMYVRPRDVPLLKVGQKVRVQFDGWPSIVFSGWPGASVGTFGGKVFAIDNFISSNGNYRVLVSEDQEALPWPKEVRVGGGANTITLLNTVKLGYEIWRQLNGFPPDYYKSEDDYNLDEKIPLKKVK